MFALQACLPSELPATKRACTEHRCPDASVVPQPGLAAAPGWEKCPPQDVLLVAEMFHMLSGKMPCRPMTNEVWYPPYLHARSLFQVDSCTC